MKLRAFFSKLSELFTSFRVLRQSQGGGTWYWLLLPLFVLGGLFFSISSEDCTVGPSEIKIGNTLQSPTAAIKVASQVLEHYNIPMFLVLTVEELDGMLVTRASSNSIFTKTELAECFPQIREQFRTHTDNFFNRVEFRDTVGANDTPV